MDLEFCQVKMFRQRQNWRHQSSLEEDTAKLTHAFRQTLVDFNRAGIRSWK